MISWNLYISTNLGSVVRELKIGGFQFQVMSFLCVGHVVKVEGEQFLESHGVMFSGAATQPLPGSQNKPQMPSVEPRWHDGNCGKRPPWLRDAVGAGSDRFGLIGAITWTVIRLGLFHLLLLKFGWDIPTVSQHLTFQHCQKTGACHWWPMSWKQQCKAVVKTVMIAYPLMQVVRYIENLRTKDLKPCTSEPCYFQHRYFIGEKGWVPVYLEVQNGFERQRAVKTMFLWEAASWGLLQTVEVTKLMPATPMYLELFEFWNFITTTAEFFFSAMVQALVQKAKPDCPWRPGLCPGKSKDDMQGECERLDNQNEALPRTACNLFVKLLCAWAFVCALHDVLLIRGHGPHVTILVGCIGLLVQELMAMAALWAAVDVTGVFPSSVNDVWCCACYYKLDDMAAIIFLVTPIFMYVNFVFKRSSLALAVVRGDCLYFREFNVPFHTVQTHAAWAESPLLLAQHGTAALEARPVRKLPDLCAVRCALAYFAVGIILSAFSCYSFGLLSSIVMPKYLLLLISFLSREPDSYVAFIANFTITFLLYGPCLLLLFCVLYSLYSLYLEVTSPRSIPDKTCIAVIILLFVVPMGLSSAWLFLPPSISPNTEGHSDELLMVCSVWSAAGLPATLAVLLTVALYHRNNHIGDEDVLRIYQALNIFLRDGHLDPDKLSPDWIAKKTRNFTPEDAEGFQLRGLLDLVQDFQNDPQKGSETWPDVLHTWLQSTYTSQQPETRQSNQSVELQQMGDDSIAPSSWWADSWNEN